MLRVVQFVFFCLTWPLAPVLTVLFSIKEILRAGPQILEAVLSLAWLSVLVSMNVVHRVLWGLGLGSRDKVHFSYQQSKHFYHEVRADLRGLKHLGRTVLSRFFRIMGLGRAFFHLESKIHRARPTMGSEPSTDATPLYRYDFEKYYEIQRRLAPGGSTAQLFVVKRVERGKATGEDQVLKYFDLTQGSHLENIVRESGSVQLATKLGLILDSRMSKTAFYYVMPFYDGPTLTQEVYRTFRPRPDDWTPTEEIYQRHLVWIRELLEVIVAYHHRGVFHKDIKPDNLIVSNERLQLIDIGLLTPLSSTLQLTTHGTEYFRDPEIVRLAAKGVSIRDVDCAKFDIYSIGAVLFFMLEGAFPASGSLSRTNRSTPFCIQWVCNRAMTDFEKRYRSANQMLRDVDDLLDLSTRMSFTEIKVSSLSSFGDDGPRFDTGPAERIPRPLPTALRAPGRRAEAPPPPPHSAEAYVRNGPDVLSPAKTKKLGEGRLRRLLRVAGVVGITGAGVFAIDRLTEQRFFIESATHPIARVGAEEAPRPSTGRVFHVQPDETGGLVAISGEHHVPGKVASGVELIGSERPTIWPFFSGLDPIDERLDREQLAYQVTEDLVAQVSRYVEAGGQPLSSALLFTYASEDDALTRGIADDLYLALVRRDVRVDRDLDPERRAQLASGITALENAIGQSEEAFVACVEDLREIAETTGGSTRKAGAAILCFEVERTDASGRSTADSGTLRIFLQHGSGLGVRTYPFRNTSSGLDR